jgi:hypothetical protein
MGDGFLLLNLSSPALCVLLFFSSIVVFLVNMTSLKVEPAFRETLLCHGKKELHTGRL